MAIPPSICVMLATSVKVRPPISTGRGSIAAKGRSPSSAFSIAFSAVHGRAEWPLTPWKTMRAFRLPRQPAWIVLSVGSSRIASSASCTTRDRSKRSGSGLYSAGQLLLAEGEQRDVDLRLDAALVERAGELEHDGETALHVARAEPDDRAVLAAGRGCSPGPGTVS